MADSRDPGGPIGPRDHVGHIEEYLRVLGAVDPNQVGALCTGDRRQGKTSLLNLLEEVLRRNDDVHVLRISAETSQPDVFVGRLKEMVRRATWLGREAERWSLDLDVSYRGIHLRRKGAERPRDEETDDILVLAARKAAPRRLVVIFDEITVFVGTVAEREPDTAVEFLHSLRRARQDGAENLSIVLSGSTGLHHAVQNMQVVNDLLPVRVGRLTAEEARFLAACLILGAGIETEDANGLASAMAAAADGGAFYLHHLADQLSRHPGPVGPAAVDAALEGLLRDPDDPLDFRHYRDRLGPYYGSDAELAGQLLDVFAVTTKSSMMTDEVVDAVAATSGEKPPRDRVVSILERLEQDHYLEPAREGTAFTSSLLRRAWIVVRRLDR